MDIRQKRDLDNYITGHYGEDQFKGQTSMTLREFIDESGETLEDLIESAVVDGVVPALCTEGCEVEMDGTCPHGNPSLLIAAGMV